MYVLGQGAHGDVINAGFGKFADGFKRHVAGYFQRRLAVGPLHRFTHQVGGEIIEHNDIRAGFKRFIQFIKRFHFHFNRNVRMQPESFFHRLTH